ncbi:MAG: hypothetical protein FGM57_03820 [Candidatus Taylorbacteria bacterium]|nr:hypothetical protein [Candidatus Taylorbacteria bacterium]
MSNRSRKTIYLIVVLAVLFSGAQAVLSWSPSPFSSPTAGNSDAPIHTGDITQKKKGDFAVSAFAAYKDAAFTNKVKIADGSQAEGKILISDANGNTTWGYPPEYAAPGEADCPPGTSVMSSTGECGYQYTLVTGGTTYCYGSDELVRYWDSGHGRNHGAYKLEPNGCHAWEGSKNYGGQSCTLECVGSVVLCYTKAGGGEWYLSGADKKCNR